MRPVSFVVQKLLAYARLLRLSNGPTAVADVWMGYAVVAGVLEPTWSLACVTLASLLLYHAGMIGNDLADVFDDRMEGRDRPIATQAIYGWDAMRVKGRMELAAVLLIATASLLIQLWLPVIIAFGLWQCIRFYNSDLKRSAAGPLLMGLCRGLNASLGMSVAGFAPESLTVPLGIVCYVAGVTLFARDERVAGGRSGLVAGLLLSLVGIGWLAASPLLLPSTATIPSTNSSWLVMWAAASLLATRGMAAAVLQPTPKTIGRGVGIAIQGLVVIDATLATLYAGPAAGLAILALLPITLLLALWIPQT